MELIEKGRGGQKESSSGMIVGDIFCLSIADKTLIVAVS